MAHRGILEETVQLIRKRMGGQLTSLALEECRVGVFFTGVRLESGDAGFAFTPVREIPEAACCPSMEGQKANNTCLHCGATSDRVVLLQCEDKGRLQWVCVRCLPRLIHGGH
jgi:hypothetical protein